MLSLMEMVRMCVSGSVLTRAEREAIERYQARRKKAARYTGRDDLSMDGHDSDVPIVSYRIPEVMMLRKNGGNRGERKYGDSSAGSSGGSRSLKKIITGVGKKVRGGVGGVGGGISGWKGKSRSESLESGSSVDSGRSFDGRTESDEYFLRCFDEP